MSQAHRRRIYANYYRNIHVLT